VQQPWTLNLVRCRADFMLEGDRMHPGGFCEITCGRCRWGAVCCALLLHCYEPVQCRRVVL
jgi:hypothetical protein